MEKTLSDRSRIIKARTARLRVSEFLENEGIELVSEIVRLAGLAEDLGDIGTAVSAYLKLLPYVHVKPRDNNAASKDSQGVTINLIDHQHAALTSYDAVKNELKSLKDQNNGNL